MFEAEDMNLTDPTKSTAGKQEEIDPLLIEGVVGDTWATYLGAAVEPLNAPGGIPVEAPTVDESQIGAHIRINGEAAWEVTLRGPWSSALEATRRMLGSSDQAEDSENVDTSDILDAWGELVNTLAGNLKASLELGTRSLSMPEVFTYQVPLVTIVGAASIFRFEWDGHCTTVSVARVTPA
jgi:hypothetical protein